MARIERRTPWAALTLLLLALTQRGASPFVPDRLNRPAAFGVDPRFDARYVHDLFIVSHAMTSGPEKTQLIFCNVTPAPLRGRDRSDRNPGKDLRGLETGETGEWMDAGAIRMPGGLGCTPRTRGGTFRWEPPLPTTVWGFGYLDCTDPFEVGGIAAISPPDKLPLLQHPDPTYSIAPGYVGVLQDELAFCRAHPSWTEALGTEAGLAFAKEQLKSGNPLVVMEATRAVAAAGKLDRETAAQLVRQGPEIRQAREVAAILCGMTKEEKTSLGQVILDAIDGVKSSEELKGLFLGSLVAYTVVWDQQRSSIQFRAGPIFACNMGIPPLTGTAPFIQFVYKHSIERQRAMGSHTAADKYLKLLKYYGGWADGFLGVDPEAVTSSSTQVIAGVRSANSGQFRGPCRILPQGRAAPPAAFGVDSTFDARCVHDLYLMSRALISSPEKTKLVFCDIDPDQMPGVFGPPHFDPKTQAWILQQVQPAMDLGTFRVLGGLGCVPRFDRGTFRWETPGGHTEWGFRYLDCTDSFQVGGAAAIPLPDKLPLLQHPDPSYSISPGYVGVLQDELAFCRAHPSWTEAVGTEAGLAFAKEQLKSGNPLVMMEATRSLAAAGKLDRETAAQLVRQGPEIRQAREVAAILCGMTKEEEATLGQVILDAIDGVKSSEELKGLFLGSIVAYTVVWDQQERSVQVRRLVLSISSSPVPLTGTAPFILSVYAHAVDKQRALGSNDAAGKYLEILEDDWAYRPLDLDPKTFTLISPE